MKLASCRTIQPWVLDEAYTAALKPEALASVTWNDTAWGLPVALEANVIFFNRALVSAVPSDLLTFSSLASSCTTPMVFRKSLSDISAFFVGSELFPETNKCQISTKIQTIFDTLNALAKAPCTSADATVFETGGAAFINGKMSEMGRFEKALGASLGVAAAPRLTFDSIPVDTRSPLKVILFYSSNPAARQSARDFFLLASSRGMAPTWQNYARMPSARYVGWSLSSLEAFLIFFRF